MCPCEVVTVALWPRRIVSVARAGHVGEYSVCLKSVVRSSGTGSDVWLSRACATGPTRQPYHHLQFVIAYRLSTTFDKLPPYAFASARCPTCSARIKPPPSTKTDLSWHSI